MANIEVNIAQNGTTTLATAGKYCDRNVDVIVAVEGGGSGLPEGVLNLTGNCSYKFYVGNWDWFIEEYGNQITTSALTSTNNMFYQSDVVSIPFDFNYAGSSDDLGNTFSNCLNLKTTGKIVNAKPKSMVKLFDYCTMMRYAPEFVNLDLTKIQTESVSAARIFNWCCSLRELPSWFSELRQNATGITSNSAFYSAFSRCYALDEVTNLPVATNTMKSNQFASTFDYCYRLKSITFETNTDGSAKTAKWGSQTIDLSRYVGWAATVDILNYNGGITKAKMVTDDTTYQALKDDSDWYTDDPYYCRYNHDSAVETINSLPDTSNYTSAYGVNTIKFNGAQGKSTDGGAINTLIEEEIAVATAKGWTVTFA